MLEKKKVPVLVGFTEKSRNANAEKAKAKWEKKGWTVVNRIDGGLTAASYLEIEKDNSTSSKNINPNQKNKTSTIGKGALGLIGILIVIGIFAPDTKKTEQQKGQINTPVEESSVKVKELITITAKAHNYKVISATDFSTTTRKGGLWGITSEALSTEDRAATAMQAALDLFGEMNEANIAYIQLFLDEKILCIWPRPNRRSKIHS